MLDPLLLDQARLLLAQGLGYTKVSQSLGISRSTLYRNINPEAREQAKTAQVEWNKNNKERINKAQKERRKRNPPKLSPEQVQRKKETSIRWAKDNPERTKIIRQRCYRKHREKRLQQTKLWRENNKEYSLQRHRNWLKNNPATVRALSADRRRRKRNSPGPHSIIERMMVNHYYQEAKELSVSTGTQYHVDHIWPLSKGGPHLPWNLRVVTAQENLSKYNKI